MRLFDILEPILKDNALFFRSVMSNESAANIYRYLYKRDCVPPEGEVEKKSYIIKAFWGFLIVFVSLLSSIAMIFAGMIQIYALFSPHKEVDTELESYSSALTCISGSCDKDACIELFNKKHPDSPRISTLKREAKASALPVGCSSKPFLPPPGPVPPVAPIDQPVVPGPVLPIPQPSLPGDPKTAILLEWKRKALNERDIRKIPINIIDTTNFGANHGLIDKINNDFSGVYNFVAEKNDAAIVVKLNVNSYKNLPNGKSVGKESEFECFIRISVSFEWYDGGKLSSPKEIHVSSTGEEKMAETRAISQASEIIVAEVNGIFGTKR